MRQRAKVNNWRGTVHSCNRSLFLEGMLEVAVRSGRWVLTHRPAATREAPESRRTLLSDRKCNAATRRPCGPISECNDVTRSRFGNFGCTGGPMSKAREPQIILKTDERNPALELGARGNSSSSQAVGMRNRVLFEGDKPEVAVERPLGDDPSARRAAPEDTTSRRSRWRVTVTAQRQSDVVRDAVTRSNAVTSNAATGVQAVRFARGSR
jgi:hypothetical protein